MSDPKARLSALLGSPGRVVRATREVLGLLEEVTPDQLETTVSGIIAVQATGEALRQARLQGGLSLRGAGEASGRSAPRIKAIEDTTTDITLSTVVEHARALGYAVTLTLTPQGGRGQAISAQLSDQAARPSGEVVAEGVV